MKSVYCLIIDIMCKSCWDLYSCTVFCV